MDSMLITILALAFIGLVALVAGVCVLAGFGWGLIALGTLLLSTAAILRKGLLVNG